MDKLHNCFICGRPVQWINGAIKCTCGLTFRSGSYEHTNALWNNAPSYENNSLKAFLENKDVVERIIDSVNNHIMSFDDVAKIIEACSPYCDEKTVDGFIMWFQSWWRAKMPKKVVEDKNGVYCPDCHEMLAEGYGDAIVLYGEKQQRFCPNCGRMVEWDD